ncbi:MAG TPA: hypothetical protein VGE98_16210 [Thermoanaerobaculia bacterium]
MLIQLLYWLKLTRLTREEVELYRKALAADPKNPDRLKVRRWGVLSIGMHALLLAFALTLVPIVRNEYTVASLENDVVALQRSTQRYLNPSATRGGGEEDPIKTLQKANRLASSYQKRLQTHRFPSVDFSAHRSQTETIKELKAEVERLSKMVEGAKKMVPN